MTVQAIEPVWSADTLQVRVTVTKDDAATDYSAATVDAAARSVSTGAVVEATSSTVTDAAGSTFDIDLTFAAGALAAGVHVLQVQVTLSGILSTVGEYPVTVNRSWT